MADNWNKKERSVTLTNEQWVTLGMFLRMTTKYREGELNVWKDLAGRTDEKGRPEFPNAEGNVEFWEIAIETVEAALKAMD